MHPVMRATRRILKGILGLLLLALFVGVVLLGVRLYDINLVREEVSAACDISEIRDVTLGGHRQKILLEGKDKDSPIIVFFHGGPGSPIPLNAGSRGLFPEITDHYILVIWDQLGAGINNRPLGDDISIESFVEMSVDLVKWVRQEYPENPILLLGVSWGSYLTAEVASAIPETIDGCVVYGQITHDLFFNEETFSALEKAKVSEGERRDIARVQEKENPDSGDIEKIAKWIGKYTEGYMAKVTLDRPTLALLLDKALGIAFSPDYTWNQRPALSRNGYRDNDTLFPQLLEVDLRPVLAEVGVPYRMIQGEKDIVTSTQSLATFMETVDNPNLRLEIVPGNAHIPGREGFEKIFNALQEETVRLSASTEVVEEAP